MKIAEVSIRRPILASMSMLALVVFGVVSFRSIGVDLFPDVEIPVVTVTVPYPGADPETVETEVVDKIEESVNTISGIKTLRSESIEGLGQVFIEFELEVNVDVASQEVRDKVAAIRGDLPLEIEAPIIEKFDVNSSPILAIVLSGPVDIRELSRYADDVVKPKIEGTPGVGNVRLVGDREREVRIWVRGDVLRAHNLSAQDVTDALRRENVEPPGGRVETDTQEMIVKTKGKVERVEDFENLIIAYRDGAPIRISDVAWVEDGLEDCRSLARLDGQRAVSLLVRRQSGTNMVAVASEVKGRLDAIRQSLPEGYELSLAQDLSVFVEDSINEAKGELVRGGVLAVLVILLFLRSLRGSLVAAITIPTTIISTFAFMLAMGFTVNMMTMLALTISVGMIIDDSIVVLENSYRHMEEGKPRMEAARLAIAEIGFAVIATSLAVLAVFVPVAFMEGIVGRFFFEFGLTVSFAVVVSTLVAVTLSPMLCSRILNKPTKTHGRTFRAIEWCLERIEKSYAATLRLAMRHRWAVVGLAVAAFASSLAVTPFLGKEFVPNADESEFNVQIETPIGTSLDATSQMLAEIEGRLWQLPGVRQVFTTVGSGVEERVNVATVLTRLVPKDQRDYSQAEIMAMARRELADLAHLKISVEVVPRISGGGFRTAPLQYNIQGRDLDKMVAVSNQVIERLKKEPGIVDVNSSYDAGKPEINVLPDRDRAAAMHVSTDKLGRAVHTLVGGEKAGRFEEGGKTYDVRVRLVAGDRDRPDSVLDVPVRSDKGQLIDLRNLVDVQPASGPVQIDREDRARSVTVFANLEESKPLDAAMEDVNQVVAATGLPEGVTTKFAGDAQMMDESFASINFSLMLAVVLIYMVLAAQFESLVHPFTVMLSLPLSIVGALGLLAVTGRTLSIFSMIGMIMLMGLVTKNAILLIDYTNFLRRGGMERNQAILTAGPVRLRPILMTALSTIAGMVPVAIGLGSGAETRAPMGTAIVGGLVTSTILTLVIVPVVYSLLDDLGGGVRRLLGLAAASDETLAMEETAADRVELPLLEPPVSVGRGGPHVAPHRPAASAPQPTVHIAQPDNETIRLRSGNGSDAAPIDAAPLEVDLPEAKSG
ncbi:MAG: efflux RND transporter permease subunit [Pirellulales bacterium]|nr:efflux RND transporter permease subunit [Pirellulales bacterium]